MRKEADLCNTTNLLLVHVLRVLSLQGTGIRDLAEGNSMNLSFNRIMLLSLLFDAVTDNAGLEEVSTINRRSIALSSALQYLY